MAGFDLVLDEETALDVGRALSGQGQAHESTDTPGLAVVVCGGTTGAGIVVAVDTSDSTDLRWGTPTDLHPNVAWPATYSDAAIGNDPISEEAIWACQLPGTSNWIITWSEQSGANRPRWAMFSVDPSTLDVTQLSAQAHGWPWGSVGGLDYDIGGLVIYALDASTVVATATYVGTGLYLGAFSVTGPDSMSRLARQTFPGFDTNGIVQLRDAIVVDGSTAILHTLDLVPVAMTYSGGAFSWTELITEARDPTSSYVPGTMYRQDASTVRFWWIQSFGGGVYGYRDVDVTTMTVGAVQWFSERWSDDVLDAAAVVSGDGDLIFVFALGGGGTLQNDGDLHPRATAGGSIFFLSGWTTTRCMLPTSGHYAVVVGYFGTNLNMRRVGEVPSERYSEADPAYPDYIDEANAGTPIAVDLSYNHLGTNHDPRPPSAAYWRPILSWLIDWGDGTTDSGSGPIDLEPYPDLYDVAFTRSHTYARGFDTGGDWLPLVNFYVTDPLGTSSPSFPAYLRIDPAPIRPPQRQYPRDDGLGISTRRSWPPPTSKQYGSRRGPTATYW